MRGKTHRHPFAIYADFETLLVKTDEVKMKNTKIFHKHEAMSYGLIVKASEDVPTELLGEQCLTKILAKLFFFIVLCLYQSNGSKHNKITYVQKY